MPCTCGTRPTLDATVNEHSDSCEFASIMKGEVVELIENGSGSIIDDYLLLLEAGIVPAEAREGAIHSAIVSVSCFLGLGSCGGSGCKH